MIAIGHSNYRLTGAPPALDHQVKTPEKNTNCGVSALFAPPLLIVPYVALGLLALAPLINSVY